MTSKSYQTHYEMSKIFVYVAAIIGYGGKIPKSETNSGNKNEARMNTNLKDKKQKYFNCLTFGNNMSIKKIICMSLVCFMALAALTLTTGCQEISASNRSVNIAADEWHFIVVGDSRGGDVGVNSKILTEIAAEIVKVEPDFVMFPGDLVTGSRDSGKLRDQLTKWRGIMQPVYDAGIAMYNVRGNHDLGSRKDSSGFDVWNEVFSGSVQLVTVTIQG